MRKRRRCEDLLLVLGLILLLVPQPEASVLGEECVVDGEGDMNVAKEESCWLGPGTHSLRRVVIAGQV